MVTDNYFESVCNNLSSFSYEQKEAIYNLLHHEQSRADIEYYFDDYAKDNELTELSRKYNVSEEHIIDVLANNFDKNRKQNEYDNWADNVNYDIDFCLKDMI